MKITLHRSKETRDWLLKHRDRMKDARLKSHLRIVNDGSYTGFKDQLDNWYVGHDLALELFKHGSWIEVPSEMLREELIAHMIGTREERHGIERKRIIRENVKLITEVIEQKAHA